MDRNPAAPDAGFILVAVLFILAALATLVGVFAFYTRATTASVVVGEERLRGNALIASALELTALRLIGLDDETRPSSGAFAFRFAGGEAAVAFRTERARIDLNLAPKPLLEGLFKTLGAQPEQAASAADRVIGWRTNNPSAAQNKEADLYRSAGLPYGPRQAPLLNVAELRFMLGLPPDLVDRALPFVTVFNGRAQIDPNEAAPEVLAALPRMTPDLVGTVLGQRNPRTAQVVQILPGEARDHVAIGGPGAVRASVRVVLQSGRRINAEVVILPTDGRAEPYRILAWRDDFDGAF